MAGVIYHKNIYILLVDDVTFTVYKVMSLNIRSLLIKTLDRSAETLGHECRGPLVLYTRPDFDGPLLNFTLFLKLGSPSRLEAGQVAVCPALSAALCKNIGYQTVAMFKLKTSTGEARSTDFVSVYIR